MTSSLKWRRFFLSVADLAAKQSPCLRRQVGAVAVVDNHIVSTGYNGPPSGHPHCKVCARDGLASGENLELCHAVHAEQNVIAQAAMHGTALKGAEVFCTHQPCNICFRLMNNAGIKAVYFVNSYPSDVVSEDLGDCHYAPLESVLAEPTLTPVSEPDGLTVYICDNCGWHTALKTCSQCGNTHLRRQ